MLPPAPEYIQVTWFTEQQIAVRLGVSVGTIRRLRRSGRLKAKRISGRWKISLDWMLEFEGKPDNQCLKTNSELGASSLANALTAKLGAPAGSSQRLDKQDVHLLAQKIFKKGRSASQNTSRKMRR
jgi:excisionase family DNA binding protein